MKLVLWKEIASVCVGGSPLFLETLGSFMVALNLVFWAANLGRLGIATSIVTSVGVGLSS